MSFNKDLKSKGFDILDLVKEKKKDLASRPPEDLNSRPFSTAPGRMADLQDRKWLEKKVDELTAELEKAKQSTGQEIALDQLHEVPGRRRKLTEQEYAELRQNLRNNDLVSPITVRPREGGGYEIISGHNRTTIFRELGRTTIPAFIHDTDDARADLNAFFANLLQTDLTDYEKYLGFSKIKERMPDLSHDDIADLTGVSRSQVTKLMAFSALPATVHALLAEHSQTIGANAAQEFAALTKAGKGEKVVEAITRIAEGKLDQAEAIKFAASEPKTTTAVAKPETIKIKAGKSTFCSMRRAQKVIRLEFQTTEEAEELQEAIRAFLEEKAKTGKKTG